MIFKNVNKISRIEVYYLKKIISSPAPIECLHSRNCVINVGSNLLKNNY